MSTEICMIVAANHQGVIGLDNKLPWHIPEDLQYFKATTMGHPVVMGRKTFESIGKPLPGRVNYVLTRSSIDIPGVTVIDSPESVESDTGKVFIIGGSEVYKAYEGLIDTAYITRVDLMVDGDAYLPFTIAYPEWRLTQSELVVSASGIELDFQVWKKK